MREPEPGELDRDLAGAVVAGLADALFAPALAAVVGRAGEPEMLPTWRRLSNER
jgi:hypothetical protein